jgi:hypothetical protein
VRLGLREEHRAKRSMKIIKCGVNVTRTLKNIEVAGAAGVIMVLEIVLEYLSELGLSSLPMSETIRVAGGGGHEVPKVGVEGVIVEANEHSQAVVSFE